MKIQGVAFFSKDDGVWFLERDDGSVLLLEKWPSANLYCCRDENRKVEAEMDESGNLRFLRFLEDYV